MLTLFINFWERNPNPDYWHWTFSITTNRVEIIDHLTTDIVPRKSDKGSCFYFSIPINQFVNLAASLGIEVVSTGMISIPFN